MSVKINDEVWRYSENQGADLLMLLAIADNTNEETREANPSIDLLMQKTRMPRRTVFDCLRRLNESGELETVVKGAKGRPTVRRVRDLHHKPMRLGAVARTNGVQPTAHRSVSSPSVEPKAYEGPETLDQPVEEPKALHLGEDYREGSLERTSEVVATSSGALVSFFVDEARARGADPPKRVVGAVAQQIGQLLDKSPDLLRSALVAMIELGKPAVALPDLVFKAELASNGSLSYPKRYGRGLTAQEIFDQGAAMTEREARSVIALLAAAFPEATLEQPTVDFWAQELCKIPTFVSARVVADRIVTHGDKFPSFAEFRRLYTEERKRILDRQSRERGLPEGETGGPSLEEVRAYSERIGRTIADVDVTGLERAGEGKCDDCRKESADRYLFGSVKLCLKDARARLRTRARVGADA